MAKNSESKGSNKVDGVTIKQEKVTPPSSPSTSRVADGLAGTSVTERKPITQPILSSNEILADLFKVFNAAPPTIEDTSPVDTKSHKKVKKEKKSKKHKKDNRRDSDSDAASRSSSDAKSRKVKKEKKRKVKKEKKHKKSKDERDSADEKNTKTNEPAAVKREPADDSSTAAENEANGTSPEAGPSGDAGHSSTVKEVDDKRKQFDGIQVSVTKDTDGATSKRKIVIKSLVNSEVFKESVKESERRECERKERGRDEPKERKRRRDGHSRRSEEKRQCHEPSVPRSRESSLSLSDEETYLRERERDARRVTRERHRDQGDRGERERDRAERDRNKDRDREREIDDFYGSYRPHKRDRSDHYHHDRRRSRSPHRRTNSEDRIDKKHLLEIARKNAISMLRNGTLPGVHNLAPEAKEKALAKMRYGGKSVDELTEFCKKLSKGETNGYLSNMSGDSDIDGDLEKPFHHPFVIKDRGPIVMNIKNSTPIPPKTAEQTKAILMQFPVSSGQIHRANESEWVPVDPAKKPKKDKEPQEQQPAITSKQAAPAKPKDAEPIQLPTADYGYSQPAMFQQPEITPTPVPPPVVAPAAVPVPVPVSVSVPRRPEPAASTSTGGDNIFAEMTSGGSTKDLDVTAIITSRLNAMRKLQDNPLDSEALKLMYNTQKDMSAWAKTKFVPGQFTGSTGASILSTKELASGFQAWAKRDQLIQTAPVSGGMGMHLLQKMGWKPGEGLGKEKNGSLQPLLLEVKLDKKGLVADEENPRQRAQRAQMKQKLPVAASYKMAKAHFESKHPVSLLGELSAKRKLGVPQYELVLQEGPSHQRQFLFKVEISGQYYQTKTTSLNKKEAKAAAARYALQQMGYLPRVESAPSQQQPAQPAPVPAPPPPLMQPMNQIPNFKSRSQPLSSFQNF